MIRQLYITAGISTTDSASLDWQEDDVLEEVHLECWASGAIATADTTDAFLSFASSATTHTVNDTQQNIASIRLMFDFTTSGLDQTSKSVVIHPNVKVFAGERLYLHLMNGAITIAGARATLITKSSGSAPATRRR